MGANSVTQIASSTGTLCVKTDPKRPASDWSITPFLSIGDEPSNTGGPWLAFQEEPGGQIGSAVAAQTPWVPLRFGVGLEGIVFPESGATLLQACERTPSFARHCFEQSSQATLDVTSGKLGAVVNELVQLQTSADDEGLERPTDYAYGQAAQVIGRAYSTFWLQESLDYNQLVKPNITTDDLGGIRISWQISGRVLRANFGADRERRSYLYFEDGHLHDVEDLGGETLAERLRWLIRK